VRRTDVQKSKEAAVLGRIGSAPAQMSQVAAPRSAVTTIKTIVGTAPSAIAEPKRDAARIHLAARKRATVRLGGKKFGESGIRDLERGAS
jgi:hypothetical protein